MNASRFRLLGSALLSGAALLPTSLSLAAKPQPTQPAPYGQDPALYQLAFAEEFDRFNSATWNDHIWYENSDPTKNWTVEKGVLKIWPQRNAQGLFVNRTLDTDGKVYQRYGYIEVEAKLPIGKGVWSGFWMLNHDIPAYPDKRPETDSVEAYPGAGPNTGWADAAYHPTAYSSTVWTDLNVMAGSGKVASGDISTGFHKYGLKWEATQMTFYFDGREVYRLAVNMSDPMYMILNVWFGGPAGEPDSSTPTGKSNSLEVNYLRTWSFR